jgi:hypothetical protein
MKQSFGLEDSVSVMAPQASCLAAPSIRLVGRFLGALARYRWRGARSGKSRQEECQQARSGITVIAMSSFTAANPCRA